MNLPNDWEIKKCLRMALAILLAILGLVGLAALGFDILILRQIVGFIFLTFIPGILILRILKIHNVGMIESLLYSVGLSIAFVYLTGLFANFILPLTGISKPIALVPVTVTLPIFTLILGVVAYKRDRDFSAGPKQFNIAKYFSPPYLFLLVLPFLAIFGARLVNLSQNNSLLLFFVIVIGCVVALVAFDRLPRGACPFAIVMIAFSLLLHVTLISSQLSGYDIHVEYYFQNLVAQNGYWDFAIPHNYNTAVSAVLLCPIYSLLLNMDAVWVFKIIYPFVFSLVPLALFHIFREQIGGRKAFFAAFFFMTMQTFFTEMTGLARQQIGELFFALLILLLIDRRLALNQRATLAIIFAMSLIMSHYALGYICLFFLLVGWGIVALIRSHAGKRAWGWLTQKFGGLPQSIISQGAFPHKIMAVIISVYLVFALSWYGGISQGTALNTIQNIGQGQYSLLSSELPSGGFFDPTEREALVGTALGLDFASVSPLGKGFRIFQYLTELFIVIGFLRMILKPKGFKFRLEYIALSTVAALILLACIVLPRFSTYLNVTRFYHISLFLLAPLFVLGGEAIWHGASRLVKSVLLKLKVKRELALSAKPNGSSSAYLRFLALAILIPYFLFNTGFLFEVTRSKLYGVWDSPSSLSLSSYRLDMPVFDEKEAEAVAWLAQRIDNDTPVYGDEYGRLILYDRFLGQAGIILLSGEVSDEAYVFLRNQNVKRQDIFVKTYRGAQWILEHISLSDMPTLLDNREIIYDNGGAQILGPR
ncbi:MAG TPA: DUF2206 domain-containing protein [Dehalococcoidia bacterium]|nr:DUF2206 domain-containing protein [Dehalococcoidia bacterium]